MSNNIINLVNQLHSLTKNKEVKWKKDNPDNPNAYSFDAKLKIDNSTIEATFLIDRYNTWDKSHLYNCINFAILDKNYNIIDDVVRCEPSIQQIKPEFDALNSLYSLALENYSYFNKIIELPYNIEYQNA